MYEKILVPLDGSDLAEAALPVVTEIARVLGSRVILLNACGMSEDKCDIYQEYLNMLALKVTEQTEKKSSAVLVHGSAADEIIKYIEDNKISLTVMATHGRSGISHWAIGSVAEKIIREANRPILLLRSQEQCAFDAGVLSKVIAPLDGSKMGEAALRYVEALAKKASTEVVLFHALERQYHFAIAADTYVQVPYTDAEMKPVKAEAQAYLDHVAQRLAEKGLNVRKEIREGKAAESIIDFAGQSGINLIAMSTHGRSGLSRWVFGSVADKIIHSSCARVMVVRPAKTA